MVWWWRQRSDLETDVWLLLLLFFFLQDFFGKSDPYLEFHKQETEDGKWMLVHRTEVSPRVRGSPLLTPAAVIHWINVFREGDVTDGWMDGWVNKGLLLRPLCLSVTPGHKEHPGPVMETFHCSSDFSLQRRRGQKHQGWCLWHLTDLLTIVTKLLQLPHWLLVLTSTHQYVRSTSRTWPSV